MILASLKAKPRWVCWRNVGGKKIPFAPRLPLVEAKVNDESTWGTHDEAAALVEAGQVNGKGYVLGDGEAGVDLDDCRNSETGELAPEAQRILADLNSYTEISPSGCGVKAFVSAWLAQNHVRKGLEIYGCGRYFTVTEQHLEGTPTDIEPRASEIESLIAREFAETSKVPRQRTSSVKAAARDILDGERNVSLFRLASAMRAKGFDSPAILAALVEHNKAHVHPPVDRQELQTIARQGGKYPDGSEEFATYQVGNRKGQIIADNQGNIRLGLDHLGLSLRYNAFANVALVSFGGNERPLDDAILHKAWLALDESFRFRPPIEFFQIVVDDLARRQTFHPVRDYLNALTWDESPRIDRWLIEYGGAKDTPYVRAVGALFLIAAVRRVRFPGCKFDELPILESKQGTRKSQALRALCPNEDWFSDDLPLGVDAKQIIERTAGKWLIEASELQGYTNSEIERLKGMLSRQVDGPVRLAYARTAVEVRRQFVLAGTTNEMTEYLRDSTGNRRFWPVRVLQFDPQKLTNDRDQLWAEAAHREAAGESIRLPEELWPAAAAEQDARRQVDPWEEVLDARMGERLDGDAVAVTELWAALGDAGKFFKRNDAERLARIMQRRGFTRKKKVDVTKKGQAAGRQWAWVKDGSDPASVEIRVSEPAQEGIPF